MVARRRVFGRLGAGRRCWRGLVDHHCGCEEVLECAAAVVDEYWQEADEDHCNRHSTAE